MNIEYEKRVEAGVDRELKKLPELEAPGSLIPRVMNALAARTALPWYRQPWQTWPLGFRVPAFTLLLAAFGGLCYLGWALPRIGSVVDAGRAASGWFAGWFALGNALNAVLGAGVLAVKQLGGGFLWACLAALALGYALCLGLGTLCVRLALARR